MTRKPRSAAQHERQHRREASNGRYTKMEPCYAGCGRRLNPAGRYFSHELTDTVDAEGVGFGDLGLVICEPCAKACHGQRTAREFIAFVRTNDPVLADRLAECNLPPRP